MHDTLDHMTKQKPTADDLARLATGFRNEIAHKFDPALTLKMSYILDAFVHNSFISRIRVAGIEQLTAVPAGTPMILSCVHKSHLDYLLLGLALYQQANKFLPATIAGKNLFHGLFRHLLPRLKGICLDRVRANPKNLRSRENVLYLSTFYDYILEDVMRKGDALTIFPEGGRSYDGRILPLSLGVFAIAKRALAKPGDRVALVPVSVSYDRVTEDDRFSLMGEKKEASRRAYRRHDLHGFYHHGFIQPKSNAYIDIGEPMFISDVKHLDDLEAELRRRMGALVRVTAVALVCRALEGKTDASVHEVMAHMKRDLAHAAAAKLRMGSGIRNRSVAHVFRASLTHLDNPFRMRQIIRVRKRTHGMYVTVVRDDVVSYYARTVEHLFPDGAPEGAAQ